MTRGNQRELARAKNQKKTQEQGKGNKGKNDGLTVEQRKLRDAEVMRDKQKKKDEAQSSHKS